MEKWREGWDIGSGEGRAESSSCSLACVSVVLTARGAAEVRVPQWGGGGVLTFIEVPPKLVIGTALNNVSHVLCLLVDGHGPDGRARGWWCGHFDLDGACLGNLTVQFLQKWGVLEERRGSS